MRAAHEMGIDLPAGDAAAFQTATETLAALTRKLESFQAPAADPAAPAPDVIALDGNAPIAAQFARIERDGFGCFTRLLKDRAFAPPASGPLSGATFAVKDLFDIAGIPTTAGSASRAAATPAKRDAAVVTRLLQAGAVLTATCNMDEFAYGFVTVNAHYGTTRNPHDPSRIAGGSSGGSAAAVAARLVRFALGSDTNGSIRVPAALCGIYGLRSTHGLVPPEGSFAFVESLDVVGPFATTVRDLRSVHEVMSGAALKSVDVTALRIARLDGWFRANVDAALAAGIDAIAAHLGSAAFASWPEPELARACAFVLTAAEGGARHLGVLRDHADALDPGTRARLAAGAVMPAGAVVAAQRFRDWFDDAMRNLWQSVDVVIAPSAPAVAPRIDDCEIELDGRRVPARAYLGLFTQPVSLAGCPVLAAPLKRPGQLPLGIQLIAAPGREDALFALAQRLEADGLIGSDLPPGAA
jgi:AtzE family amidohydrolase